MAALGTLSLWLAAAAVLYGLAVLAQGWRSPHRALTQSGTRAAVAIALHLSLAAGLLFYALGASDFRFVYVAEHTSRELPLFFKLSAFWGGQAGSLLLWSWLLALFTLAVIFFHRREFYHTALLPVTVAVLMSINLFFICLNLFIANPFELSARVPANGAGLNPLLQHWAMALHPPMLYLGFVGLAVPFAFAIAALLTAKLDSGWISAVRRWTLVPWLFLSLGILMGAKWAYVELGWGGYWAWDPVENASLMPWLTATAFLHSIMIQEKKGMLKIWNMILAILSFELSIFGTFITRSGVISSVHAFAKSGIGPMFMIFLATNVVFCVAALWRRLPELRAKSQLESVLSRESTFLFNNLILLGAMFAVLWGTVFPLVSEAVRGVKITVGPPFFNQVNVPMALALLALTGIGPVLAWRRTSAANLRRQFMIPVITMMAGGAALWLAGVRHAYAFGTFALSILVTATIAQEFIRGVRARQHAQSETIMQALRNLVARNQRRYGGYIVHFGMVLIFVGIAGSAFNREADITLSPGESAPAGRYRLEFEKTRSTADAAMSSLGAELKVFERGKLLRAICPEKRMYRTHEQPTTEVAIISRWDEDLYVVLAGVDEKERATLKVYINPLVRWLWAGGLILVAGTLIALLPLRKTARATGARAGHAGSSRRARNQAAPNVAPAVRD